MIYQLVIPVVKELLSLYPEELPRSFPSNPMFLVVSPLNALITDQMESCKTFGLKTSRLDELNEIGDQDIDVIFTSPETLEKTPMKLFPVSAKGC